MQVKKALVKGLIVFTMAAPICGVSLNAIHAEGETQTTQTTTDTTDQATVKSGWQSDGTYYDPTTHTMLKGLQSIDGAYYYLDDTTGVKKVSTWVSNSYFDKNGKRLESGAHTISGVRYYFTNGEKVTSTWVGNSYYNASGARIESGKATISGKTYYFKRGVKVTNTWVGSSYYGSDGALITTGYVVKNGKSLYIVNGKYYTGVRKVNGAFRYFNKGVASTKTGWIRVSANLYYFKRGKAVTGLTKVGKYYYYFKPSNAKLYKGFKTVGSYSYYFKKGGKLYSTYGSAATGLFKVNGKTYYANNKGQLARNKSVTINGKKYTFNNYGQAKSVISMDAVTTKAQKYSSPTKYLMMVDTTKHRVYAFTGSKNNWKKIKTFVCTNGKASTPTKKGVFHIGTTPGKYKRALYFTENSIRCWYATRIVNGILFHSVLYTISSSPTTISDGRLGVAASHGCVRLALANAKWIYRNVPNNTTVVIY